MKTKQKAFSLIELMMVVAIIGILASIAIPSYRNYISKTQFAAGLAEISPGKSLAEINIDENSDVSINVELIGLANSTQNCSIITATSTAHDGTAFISCKHIGSPAINNKTTTLSRDIGGTWNCNTEVSAIYSAQCLSSAS